MTILSIIIELPILAGICFFKESDPIFESDIWKPHAGSLYYYKDNILLFGPTTTHRFEKWEREGVGHIKLSKKNKEGTFASTTCQIIMFQDRKLHRRIEFKGTYNANKTCFIDGIHNLPLKGEIMLNSVFNSFAITWTVEELSEGMNYIDGKRKTKRSSIVYCPVLAIPWFGVGGARCDISGATENLEKRINERYENTQSMINNMTSYTESLINHESELIGKLSKDLSGLTINFKNYEEKAKEFDQKMIEMLQLEDHRLTSSIEAAIEENMHSQVEIAFVQMKIMEMEIESVLEKLLFISRTTSNCSEINSQSSVKDYMTKHVIQQVTMNKLSFDALKEAFHDKISSMSTAFSGIANLFNNSIKVMEDGSMIHNSTIIGDKKMFSELNSVIKDNGLDTLKALSSRKRNIATGILDIIIFITMVVCILAYICAKDQFKRNIALLVVISCQLLLNIRMIITNFSLWNLLF